MTDDEIQAIRAAAVAEHIANTRTVRSNAVKDQWKKKKKEQKIFTSVCPAWMERKGDVWVVIPDKVRVVEQVFNWAHKGFTPAWIATKLTTAGTPTMGTAADWTANLVLALLKNSAVTGQFKSKRTVGDVIDNHYPVIIDMDVFVAVQKNIERRRASGGAISTAFPNLFRGMLYCECGSKVRYVAGKPKPYVHCMRSYSNLGCDAEVLQYWALEAIVLHELIGAEQVDFGVAEANVGPSLTALRGEIAEVSGLLTNLAKALEQGDPKRAAPRTVLENIRAHESRLEVLNATLQLAMDEAAAAQKLKGEDFNDTVTLYEQMRGSSGEARGQVRLKLHAALKRVIDRIVLERRMTLIPAIANADERNAHNATVPRWNRAASFNHILRRLAVEGPVVKLIESDEEHRHFLPYLQRTPSGGFVLACCDDLMESKRPVEIYDDDDDDDD